MSVNVWKRHLNLQSVFNHGECMMHEDKNTNSYVLDQNVDRISREIAYVPLSGRIRSKRSSCMQPSFFFFFFLKKKNEYRTCLPMIWWIWSFERASEKSVDLKFGHGPWIWNLDMLPRGPMDWNLGHSSQRSVDLNLDMLPKGPMDWSLDVLPRGPMVWNLRRASQRSVDLNLDVLPRGPIDWSLDVFLRGPMDWNLGRAS